MNGTQLGAIESQTSESHDQDTLTWLFEGRPDGRTAIRERLQQFPEYAAWLQGMSSCVPRAVESEN